MITLKKGDNGNEVLELQQLLINAGIALSADGDFGRTTLAKVKEFQSKLGLTADGVVGPSTWAALKGDLAIQPGFNAGIREHILAKKEYMQDVVPKKTIYLHHTAGGPRPDYTIDWWKKDGNKRTGKPRRVGTAFVIGRRSQKTGDRFDGVTYRCFDEKYWAHHIGVKLPQNERLNKESIGIEICNYGYLEKIDGQFLFAKRTPIPEEEVCVLEQPWRGHRYFEKYTAKQIEETKRLILTMAYLHKIPIPDVKYDIDSFDMKYDAHVGKPGIWMHCNIRYDKTDCFPQPEFIDMLNSLHEASKTFEPEMIGEEAILERTMEAPPTAEELENYSGDLNDI